MMPQSTESQPSDPKGPTGKLCTWIGSISADEIPQVTRTRAKYLILDGLACCLHGAHLPSSERAVHAVFDMEPGGASQVFGWERKIGPLSATLLNSTFIQGFELDDWHSEAPMHSNSVILPALFAVAEHLKKADKMSRTLGTDFLLAYIVGCEVGPRVGLGLYGERMLTQGWHSGAIFGPSASCAAASKLLKLPTNVIEDALGIACTQACGLMSAQFESEVKRMQHGFAARNGLFAALLARSGYIGIKQIYERAYGGFLATFASGNGEEPPYRVDEVAKELGTKWQIDNMRVKPYASMAGTHCTVDCVRALQADHPEQMKDLTKVTRIKIDIGREAAFHHGGWKAEQPITSTGAQMSNAYVAATQMVDGQVLPAQFRQDQLDRSDIWDLVHKTTCVYRANLIADGISKWTQEVTVMFENGLPTLTQRIQAPRGVDPPLTNEDILRKWRFIMQDVIDNERMEKIEVLALGLEQCEDITLLGDLLAGITRNPIA